MRAVPRQILDLHSEEMNIVFGDFQLGFSKRSKDQFANSVRESCGL